MLLTRLPVVRLLHFTVAVWLQNVYFSLELMSENAVNGRYGDVLDKVYIAIHINNCIDCYKGPYRLVNVTCAGLLCLNKEIDFYVTRCYH